MEPTTVVVLGLVVLGVAVALDGTSVAQIMISRPLVSATLAGTLVGVPEGGFLAGLVLELFFLPVLPIGGGKFPEAGPAGVVAGATAAAVPGPGALPVALLLGIGVGAAGGTSIRWLRRVNGRWAPAPTQPALSAGSVRRAHRRGLLLDGLRGAVLVLAGMAVAFGPGQALAPHWPLDERDTAGLVLAGAALPLGLLLTNLQGRRGSRLLLLAAGMGIGALLVLAVV